MDNSATFLAFIEARLADDDRVARAATPGPWAVDDEQHAESVSAPGGTTVVGGGRWGGEASAFESTEDALHITRHNPARVLAEAGAKRRIVELHGPAEFEYSDVDVCSTCDRGGPLPYPCPTLRLLALPYARHPDYCQEWTP